MFSLIKHKEYYCFVLFLLNAALSIQSTHQHPLLDFSKNLGLVRTDFVRQSIPLPDNILINLIDNLNRYENDTECYKSEECALEWMNEFDFVYGKVIEKLSLLNYQYETNINEKNQKLVNEYQLIVNRFVGVYKPAAIKFFKNANIQNEFLKRLFYFASLDVVVKNETEVDKLSNIMFELDSIYSTSKVLSKITNNSLALEPGLSNILKRSRDYDELLWVWKGWHDATGPKMRELFKMAVKLQNKGVQENGYKDLSEKWVEDYEVEDFESIMDSLYNQIKPFYQELHAYVRRKLNKAYSDKYSSSHNPKLIQAHLLGNMWAQDWSNIFDLLVPYPDEVPIDETKALIQNNYTVNQLFKKAEEFFVSIGLFPMTPTFWKYSMVERPSDREVVCHASAWDFGNDFDFKIKMCTQVDQEYFETIHHEMGHIEYFMAYKDQPHLYRGGANGAFHEAIGDTIALSVRTTNHLNKIGLIETKKMTEKQTINYLMRNSLTKIAFLPFGYLVDKWRWNVFRGNITETEYNKKWWEMRKEYQGLESPEFRNESYFDPGAKFHVATFSQYSIYFISFFHQFQFYKSLCDLSGNTEPLYNCDFYESKQAGLKLKEMLELGKSQHWKVALKHLTGETEISAAPLLEYYKPLHDWLIEENNKFPEEKPGW